MTVCKKFNIILHRMNPEPELSAKTNRHVILSQTGILDFAVIRTGHYYRQYGFPFG